DFYYETLPALHWREIDLDSGFMRIGTFTPLYEHPVWKPKQSEPEKELVLVSASGGIDSGLTAWTLKKLGYDVRLVHFNYGQKGHKAEALGVKRLAEAGNMDYVIIDVRDIFKRDKSSLIAKDVEIHTAEEGKLKTTTAWVSARNLVFLSILTSMAEQAILSNEYDKVYIASGTPQLSEAGFYPDNSEVFYRDFCEVIKTATITPTRIHIVPVMAHLMKYKEWLLGDALGFPFEHTVSCDEPIIDENGEIRLCRQCGFTLLSIWGARMAGVKDPRKFYDRERQFTNFETRPLIREGFNKRPIEEIVQRLILPKESDYEKLLTIVKK
ncbi:MAG: 7-cyano-7-deazaguanine synthase, partial [Nanopusillaceae archaeon]